MEAFDCLIVGRGLAGSALALRLIERGWSVLVVDRGEDVTASRVAAGLVTPITGKNLTLSWRIDELLPAAVEFYRGLQRRAGARIWHAKPVARVLRSEEEAGIWRERSREQGFQAYLSKPAIPPDRMAREVRAPFGGFEMRGGGYVDIPVFLETVHRILEKGEGNGSALRKGEVRCADLTVTPDGVRWGGVRARWVVFCQGFEGAGNRFFDWVPFRSAKGEILDLVVDGFGDGRITTCGEWLLPLPGGRFRAGSTYAWHPLDTEPSKQGRKRIIRGLRRFVSPEFAVVGHRAAVRPVIRDCRVLMGVHPTHARVGFFNGLGSKGVLNAPFFADQFAEHLVNGGPIDENVDLRRNF